MPTENRSSNTEMVSVPPYIGLEPLVGRYYPAQCRRCGLVGSSEELTEDDAQCTRDIGDRLCLGDCDELERHDLLNIIQAMAAPQPHPEPIAWMVGTAFWWTKEEAERDAAETGLPIVGLGPLACAAPADQHQGEPAKVRVGSGQFNDDDRYLLCREELRECEDERSALSDEARELRDRTAKLDALLAEALLAIEGGCHAVSLPERISAALSCDDEQDPPSGYFFDTGPYQVELGEEQWLKALSVFDNYTQGNQDTFACPGDNLRGLVSEILIELGLAPTVD